jgi:xeroderma pigmentosum group C-complementing protein
MAPRGGRTRAGPARRGRGGTARRRLRPEDDAPDAYRDLLSGAAPSTNPPPEEDNRPLKRRKVAGKERGARAGPSSSLLGDDANDSDPSPAAKLQTIIDDSEDSDSDIEFEDVQLGPSQTDLPEPRPVEERRPLDIVIDAHPTVQKRANTRKRKPVTSAEKARRLDIHKMHVLYLLYHAFYRNHWCNDARTQACLQWTYTGDQFLTVIGRIEEACPSASRHYASS